MLGRLLSSGSMQCLSRTLSSCVRGSQALWREVADVVVVRGAQVAAKAPPKKGFALLRAFKGVEKQFWRMVNRTKPNGKTMEEFIKACRNVPGRCWTTHIVDVPVLRELPMLQARQFPWSLHRTNIFVPGGLRELPHFYANSAIGHEIAHAYQNKNLLTRLFKGWGMGPVKRAYSSIYRATMESVQKGTSIHEILPTIQQQLKRLSPKQAAELRKVFLAERQAFTLQAKSWEHFGVHPDIQAIDKPMVQAMKQASKLVSKAIKGIV